MVTAIVMVMVKVTLSGVKSPGSSVSYNISNPHAGYICSPRAAVLMLIPTVKHSFLY